MANDEILPGIFVNSSGEATISKEVGDVLFEVAVNLWQKLTKLGCVFVDLPFHPVTILNAITDCLAFERERSVICSIPIPGLSVGEK